jgi:putative transcriptional regulator
VKSLNGTLVAKRKEKGLTQQEMADQIEVSRQYYTDIENGKRQPSVSTAKKIGEVLEVEWTIFFIN